MEFDEIKEKFIESLPKVVAEKLSHSDIILINEVVNEYILGNIDYFGKKPESEQEINLALLVGFCLRKSFLKPFQELSFPVNLYYNHQKL